MADDETPSTAAVLRSVSAALQDVADNEQDLLTLGAHELALVHRFGVYLERQLDDELKQDGLTIDLDYDRHGRLSKFLPPRLDDPRKTRFRPDLILHRRTDDQKNLLVVEWKKNPADKTLQCLQERVIALLADSPEHHGYAYRTGVLVASQTDHIQWCEVDRTGGPLKWNTIHARP